MNARAHLRDFQGTLRIARESGDADFIRREQSNVRSARYNLRQAINRAREVMGGKKREAKAPTAAKTTPKTAQAAPKATPTPAKTPKPAATVKSSVSSKELAQRRERAQAALSAAKREYADARSRFAQDRGNERAREALNEARWALRRARNDVRKKSNGGKGG